MKFRIIIIILLTGSLLHNPLYGQYIKPSAKADSGKAVVKPYAGIITKTTESKKGLFTVHKNGDKYYFEIPDALLKKQLLLTTWLVQVPGGSPKFGGDLMNTKVISFEKGIGDRIALRVITSIDHADSTDAIATAIDNSDLSSIAVNFDIKARGETGKSSIIEVTDFLQKENAFTAVDNEVKSALTLTGMAADRSYLKRVDAYPINLEIKMVRTYNASGTAPQPRPGMPPARPIDAAKLGGAVTLEVCTSILLMPEKPMVPRRFDARVGYFADYNRTFSDKQQAIDNDIFIVRYRLEPKPEDMEKYKRGELVEPKQQIVYYLDPATPKQWRPYLIAGINDWNKAFEAAGFKNAIVGKEWPENDTTMSVEDARYKVIRYYPSDVANAFGRNVHDPRSGEVLQSYFGWYHNVMSLVHDWYMIQAGPSDVRARSMKFSDSLMGTLIRFVSSHEVGHTLGLRHNMGASFATPVDSLRNKAWVEKYGHTASIMDYARFNYVAQPEDHIGEAGLMPRINDYDKWAIKWGYAYTGEATDTADRSIVAKWITDTLKANPRLWFGGEGMNFDARCQTEDLGNDNMKADGYGIKNLQYVLAHLSEWTYEEGDMYKNLSDIYRQVLSQYLRYVMHVANNVASTYETFKTVEQSGDIYAPESPAKQREAVAFLNKELFETPRWLLDTAILNRIGNPIRLGSVANIQSRVLDALISDRVLNTLMLAEARYGKDAAYNMLAFLRDLQAGVFSELKTGKAIDDHKRNVQKKFVNNVFGRMKEAEEGANIMSMFFGPAMMERAPLTTQTDIGSLLPMCLTELNNQIMAAIPNMKDSISKEHLLYLSEIITNGLKNRFKK